MFKKYSSWLALGLALAGLACIYLSGILTASAGPVHIILQVEPAGVSLEFTSQDPIAGNVMAKIGILLFPGDRITQNGVDVNPNQRLSSKGSIILQFNQAMAVTLDEGGKTSTFYSSAATLGQALWEAGIHMDVADSLTPGPETQLNRPLQATLNRAVILQVTSGGQTMTIRSAAPTIGQALADAGMPLEGLDYSSPAEDQPIPANGQVRVIHVREEVSLVQTVIPYTTTYVADPNTELDQNSVVTAGQYGIQVARVRVRYEDDQQVSQKTDSTWVAKEPVAEKLGYGTKVVVRSLSTPNGTIQYWRAITVYATSYSPCRSAASRCYYGTSSGMKVQQGVIGVTRTWYNLMEGQQLYVPGYGVGTIADTGGGISGKYWIDLAYSDADYVEWGSDVTVYFLTPVPSSITYILP
jgi:resuscitation-promoting factor RpfB